MGWVQTGAEQGRRRPHPSASLLREYGWGGAASTAFCTDPVDDIRVASQCLPPRLYPVRRALCTLVNAAVLDSKA